MGATTDQFKHDPRNMYSMPEEAMPEEAMPEEAMPEEAMPTEGDAHGGDDHGGDDHAMARAAQLVADGTPSLSDGHPVSLA
jgi:hypothetical protein